ncbi:HEPN domain-containing protein [Candidatus Micrarchaeota archaeon]|nr:HEPN domain-containing protein [Candidatus Micrarchaeota archaeon]
MIKKSSTAQERVGQSLALGDKFLKSARKNIEISENESSELLAYTSLFHYARALLFHKGYLERSHVCLFIALQRLYPEHAPLFQRADKIRLERHNIQYCGLATDAESVGFVLELVEEFGAKAKELLAH